jgi:Ca-activated chloride channel family protein
MRLASPWALLLLLTIPLLLWLQMRRQGHGTLKFSALQNALNAGCSLRRGLLALPLLLRLLALLLLVIALARPQLGRERIRDISHGIAIEMVVDRSGSMRAEMPYKGQQLTRLETVKRVFAQFVSGNSAGLKGRPNDLIGMVTFARYADTVCPLTLAHGALAEFLDKIKLVRRRSEDGTAIGDAIALAAARLQTAEETLAAQQRDSAGKTYEIKSKIIILLTDGENNCGKRSVGEAADLAAQWGIKIYAIGVGGGDSFATVRTPLGDYKVPTGGGVDVATLKEVAARTNGTFRLAEDARALAEIYAEIDALERSDVEAVRFVDYREMFVPFALAGLILVALENLLTCTLFRRAP